MQANVGPTTPSSSTGLSDKPPENKSISLTCLRKVKGNVELFSYLINLWLKCVHILSLFAFEMQYPLSKGHVWEGRRPLYFPTFEWLLPLSRLLRTRHDITLPFARTSSRLGCQPVRPKPEEENSTEQKMTLSRRGAEAATFSLGGPPPPQRRRRPELRAAREDFDGLAWMKEWAHPHPPASMGKTLTPFPPLLGDKLPTR